MLKLGLWLEQIWSDFQLWANHWFSTEGQFINFILPEFNFFLFWWRLNFTFSLSKSFHFHTIQSLCILDIQEGRRSPDSDGSIVWGAGQQTGHHGVPAHTVDCACVTGQLCDGQLTAPVPDVNFVVWQERDELVSSLLDHTNDQHKTFF